MCPVSRASDTGRDGEAFKMTCHCEREVVKNILLLWKKKICAKDYESSWMEKWQQRGKQFCKIFKCNCEFCFGYRIIFGNEINTMAVVVTENSQSGFCFQNSFHTVCYRNQILNREQNLSCVREMCRHVSSLLRWVTGIRHWGH